MHITTSSHILSLADDHIYNLRKIGTAGDDSWVDSRRGEAFDRNFQVKLEKNQLCLFFEGKNIGYIALSNTPQVKKLLDLVRHWNTFIGPTDLTTIKTTELVRDWSQLHTKKQIQVKCITYNCAGLLGDLALRRELWSKIFGTESSASEDDVIVVGFQESDNLNRSVKANASTLQRCVDLSKSYLYRSHTLVSSVQLLGLMTLLFVRNPLVPFVSDVTIDTSSTGFLRVWGNKGAVLTRFLLFHDEIVGGGLELTVVNCHLSAGEGVTQLGRRRWELREIGQKFGISNLAPTSEADELQGSWGDDMDRDPDDTDSISSISDEEDEGYVAENDSGIPIEPKNVRSMSLDSADRKTLRLDGNHIAPKVSNSSSYGQEESTISSSTLNGNQAATEGELEEESPRTKPSRYVVLLGDMNYRILLPENEVQKKIKKQEWDGLLAHDSLSLERHQYSVFNGFEEPAVRFGPTYKYEIGTGNYKGRIPSYTDRILYRTACPTKVVSYNSIQDLKMSDHRPVTLRNIVEVPNCIDPEKHEQIITRSLKLIDNAENNARPKLAVDQQQITVQGPPLSTQQSILVIRNEGIRPIYWIAENAQTAMNAEEASSAEPTDKETPSQASSSSLSTISTGQQSTSSFSQKKNAAAAATNRIPSLITQGLRTRKAQETKLLTTSDDISITPGEGKITQLQQTENLKLTVQVGVEPRDFIILVKTRSDPMRAKSSAAATALANAAAANPINSSATTTDKIEESVQKYVFVRINPTKSYLGSSLGDMPQSNGIPVPIQQCVEYLRDRKVDDMFLSPAEPAMFQQVLHWLDSNENLDTQVLDTINPYSDRPAGVSAVAQVLLSLFRYLPDPIMGPNTNRKMSTTKNSQSFVSYICKFINHLQIDDDSLDVWAAVLYDHTDEKAGKLEKRAYLRSMLICT